MTFISTGVYNNADKFFAGVNDTAENIVAVKLITIVSNPSNT